jgi:hypothetical protein
MLAEGSRDMRSIIGHFVFEERLETEVTIARLTEPQKGSQEPQFR